MGATLASEAKRRNVQRSMKKGRGCLLLFERWTFSLIDKKNSVDTKAFFVSTGRCMKPPADAQSRRLADSLGKRLAHSAAIDARKRFLSGERPEQAAPDLTTIRRCGVASVIAACACALALAGSPQLHECFHHGGARASHSCAITLRAAGKCIIAIETRARPLVGRTPTVVLLAKLPILSPVWVRTLFLEGSRCEHGPPVLS